MQDQRHVRPWHAQFKLAVGRFADDDHECCLLEDSAGRIDSVVEDLAGFRDPGRPEMSRRYIFPRNPEP